MKRSIRLTWHLSYAALLSVPILIFLLVSWTTSRALEDQLAVSSETLVDLMGKEIDGKLEYVGRFLNDVTWDPLTLSLMNSSQLDSGAKRFDMVRLADELALANGYSRFSDFVFLSFPNLHSVLIPRSLYSEAQFHKSYFLGTGITLEGLVELMSQRHEGDSIPLAYLDDRGQIQQAVAVLKSLPPSPSLPPAATVGILINTSTVIDSLHATIKASRSEIRILNEAGQVIVTTLKGPLEAVGQGGAEVRINGETYTVLQQKTQKFAWTVQLLVPDSTIKGNLLGAQLAILAGLVACLVLGLGLTVYLVRRNYGPVNRLLEALSILGPRPDAEEDEFSVIQRTVTLVRDRFERNKEPLRQNLTAGLLRGRAETTISLDDSLAALGVVFVTDEFVVLLVQIDDESGPSSGFLDVFCKELETCLDPWATTLRGPEDNPVAFLLNLHSASTASTLADLQEGVVLCGQNLRETLGLSDLKFASAFSSVVQGVSAIPTAWRQAKTALEYRFVVGGAHPFTWDELKLDKPAALYHYDGDREARLMTVVQAGEADAAVEILNEIFAENSRPGTVMLSALAAQCLVWDLVATMMKALAEVAEDESFIELFHPVSSLAQNTQWDKVRSGLVTMVREACQFAQTQNTLHLSQLKSNANRQFIQTVCSYLQTQFRDSSLDLTKIAEAHSLTPAYLSRLFRENTEEGIFDYLNRLRIENAKTLLRSGTGNLQEVGLASGFVDVKTFIRNFRRFAGVTPGKYRETVK